jgi:NitT/TauT family transport system substrate-binding protein
MKNQRWNKVIGIMIAVGLIMAFSVGCAAQSPEVSESTPPSEVPAVSEEPASEEPVSEETAPALKKTVISYAGGTCEAPTFVALHKGFFEEEGLDVELVQTGFEQLKLGLDSGEIDAAQSNFAWFKPIEQGLNIKLTAGIHTGCIKAVTPPDSGIETIADLKGKAVGVDAIGGGPQIALSAKLRELGIDPVTEVEWKAYPGPQLEEAINKGEIVAYMTWDPFPTQAHDHNGYNVLLDIGADDPFKDNYCCFVGVSAKVVEEDPDKAAAITRAFLKASEWVAANPEEAAQIAVDNGYIGGDVELNTQLLASYNWEPSIGQAKENIRYYITEQKAQGILEAGTSEEELYNRVFAEVIPDYNGK